MNQTILENAVQLRHELHQHPELSGHETETKQRLISFLQKNASLEIVDRGLWFYAKYSAAEPTQKPIAFRADFDAIKVFEDDALPYASVNAGVAHKCGHDGHASALAAFAADVSLRGLKRDAYFIFQHGEETGIGGKAASMLLEETAIDEIYAIHNYPGKPVGSVNTREKTICFGSVGVRMDFTGVATHASTPELGKNPAKIISELVLELEPLTAKHARDGLVLATVVQIDVGEEAFGVSAGSGKLLLTVRGERQKEYRGLLDDLCEQARQKAEVYGFKLEISYHDYFPETYNHAICVNKIKKVCKEKGFPYAEMKEALRTSEDFGYFTQKVPGAMIWLGSGENTAPLHNPRFDYPDELISKSEEIFWALAEA